MEPVGGIQMEWTEALCQAIRFIEAHLTDDIDACTVARVVYMSPFYFQKGFALMTGYTVGEYIRLRRLSIAALDIAYGKEKVIDAALGVIETGTYRVADAVAEQPWLPNGPIDMQVDWTLDVDARRALTDPDIVAEPKMRSGSPAGPAPDVPAGQVQQ